MLGTPCKSAAFLLDCCPVALGINLEMGGDIAETLSAIPVDKAIYLNLKSIIINEFNIETNIKTNCK